MDEFKLKADNRIEAIAAMQEIEQMGYRQFDESLPSSKGPSFFYCHKAGDYMIGQSPSFFRQYPYPIKSLTDLNAAAVAKGVNMEQ